MTLSLSLLLVAAAAEPAQAPAASACRLIADDGTVLGFTLATRMRNGAVEVEAKPEPGSRWPAAATGYLRPIRPTQGVRGVYSVGGGPVALHLTLGGAYPNQDWQSAELAPIKGEEAGLPSAFGYCSENASKVPLAAPAPFSADDEALDGGIQCHLLGRDGRRARFVYQVEGRSATIRPLESSPWPGGPVVLSRMSPPSPPGPNGLYRGFATAGGDDLPSLAEILTVDTETRRAIVTLRFHNLGDAEGGNDAGFAICGINDIDRVK